MTSLKANQKESRKTNLSFPLQVFGSVKDVVECFLRRSLCYPLHRNWRLSLQVHL